MSDPDELAADSIYVFREAYAELKNVAILCPIGKDSNVVLWLAKKAFCGHVPFPVLFIDTEKEFPQVYVCRDRRIEDWGLNYVQEQCPPGEEMDPTLPPAALLLIDDDESVQEQACRHGYLLSLLGLPQRAVLVNKMGLVGYDERRFGEMAEAYRAYLASIGVAATGFVPIPAREGDDIAAHSLRMPWYQGPRVLGMLDGLLPRPILAGRVEAGRSYVGDEVTFSPSNKSARIRSLEAFAAVEGEAERGRHPREPDGVERGEMMSHPCDAPMETNVFKGRLFWLGEEPLAVGASYSLNLGTLECPLMVNHIDLVVDTEALDRDDKAHIERNAVGERFHENSIRAPIEFYKRGDSKGFHRRTCRGEIRDCTGVSASYGALEYPHSSSIPRAAASTTRGPSSSYLQIILV
jgi:hypothetical protein